MKYTCGSRRDEPPAVDREADRDSPSASADQRADDADHQPLQRGRSAGSTPTRIPIALQDADLARLVLHHHRQRADDVERRDEHDQQQDHAHAELLELERLEERAVLLLPVLRRGTDSRAVSASRAGELRRVASGRPSGPRARHRGAEPRELLRRVHRHDRRTRCRTRTSRCRRRPSPRSARTCGVKPPIAALNLSPPADISVIVSPGYAFSRSASRAPDHHAAQLAVGAREAEIPLHRVAPDVGHRLQHALRRLDPRDVDALDVIVPRGREPLREHEGRRRDDARLLAAPCRAPPASARCAGPRRS